MIKNQYAEFMPSDALSDLVECYWYSCRISDFENSVILPDTCMDIVFNILDIKKGLSSQFVGLMLQASEHVSADITEYFGVRFKPFSIIKYLSIDAYELTDVSVALDVLFGQDAKQLEYQIAETDDNQMRMTIMETYLLKLIENNYRDDLLIDSALNKINNNLSGVKVNLLAKELFISEKQFQRKFKQRIGTTPKKFIDILKLRNLTKDLHEKDMDLSQLVYDYGFYDQSHYLKVVKKYYSKQ